MGLTARDYVKTEQHAYTPPDGEFDMEIVPFGIYHVDANFLMGVSPTMPQWYAIQGISGARKTTLAFNLIINMCLSQTLPPGHKIIYDILESGQTIEKCLTIMRCMIATRYMIYRFHTNYRAIESGENTLSYLSKLFSFEIGQNAAQIIGSMVSSLNGVQVPLCVLKPSFIRRFYLRKIAMLPIQREGWLIAGDALNHFPLEIFGVSGHYNRDTAKKLSVITDNIEVAVKRWAQLTETCESLQVFTDHLNAYNIPGKDYDKQVAIVPFIDHFIKEYRCTVWTLFQEGVTNRREYDLKGEALGGKGGDTVKAASDTNWRVSYSNVKDPFHMILHAPVKSREGDHPDLKLMIEPNSGVLFGKSEIITR